jgi:putative endonuclease
MPAQAGIQCVSKAAQTVGARMIKEPCVYIMARKENGTLYVGVTSNLVKRVFEHREGLIDGFTRKYDVKKLVWFEPHENMESAIVRETQLKKWNRAWKVREIGAFNPGWRDLYDDITR